MARPRRARSNLEEALDAALHDLYPCDIIKADFPIKVRGRTLYVDRVVLGPNIAVEADGRQHSEFVPHFHKDSDGFKSHQERDRLKAEWLAANGYTLVRFSHTEPITAATLRKKVLEALKL